MSVPPEVPLREFPYNAVVELVNPVADTVSRKTYTGADVDWYVKAEDIVLKNKGNGLSLFGVGEWVGGGGGAGRVVWGYGYHVVVHRRPATA